MSQPPPPGPPPGQPPQGPSGGQPPMGPPGGGPPGYPPGGDPYGHDPYGQGGYGHDPYGYGPYGPPPGGQQFGQQPPPQKSTSPWLWVGLGGGCLFLVICVVLALIIVFVVAADDDEPAPSGNGTGNGGTAGDGAQENPDMPGMNEEVTHDGMVFTVTQVETDVPSVEGARPAEEYVIVHVDVASATGSAETFWTDEQHIYTSDGAQHSEDYDATWDLNGGHSQALNAGGTSESLQIAFDVPDADEVSHIGLSTQTLGGNEVEVDLTG